MEKKTGRRITIHHPSRVELLTEERYTSLTTDQLKAITKGGFSKKDVIGRYIAMQPEHNKKEMVVADGHTIKVLVFSHTDSTYFETTIAITICGQTYIEWDTLISG